MLPTRRTEWFRAALLVGVAYFIVGRGSIYPANQHFWRLAAWMISSGVYVVHFCYEYFTLRNSPRFAALHMGAAVAIGAFALAVAGMIHSLSATSSISPAWLLAFVFWPAVTAVPAFLGALVAGTAIERLRTGHLRQQ